MNLKKFVGSTVDVMTLSYTERHLKEALDQEHAIPTTILSVIAEKSHNDYNLTAIMKFFDKAFKNDLKEWKKYRNLVKIIEYLLRYGSINLINSLKKYQSELRMLQNYSMMDQGADRGAIIRENATLIVTLLSNYRELDEIREQSRKLREKYSGISSDHLENQYSYKQEPYSSSNNSTHCQNPSSAPEYKQPSYSEANKKIANSLFAGYNQEETFQNPNIEKKNYETRAEYHEKPGIPDIFASGKKNFDIFARKEEVKSESTEIFVRKEEIRSENVDIFARKEEVKSENIDIFARSAGKKEEKPVDIFAGVVRRDNRGKNSYVEVETPEIVKKAEFVESKGYVDIFGTKEREVKSSGQYDIFEAKGPISPQLTVEKPPSDLFQMSQKIEMLEPLPQKSLNSDIFSGMVQKRTRIPSENPIIPQKTEVPIVNPSWDLGLLDIKILPEASSKPNPTILPSKESYKIKSNLVESPSLPAKSQEPKMLSAEELEKKLINLDF